MKNNVTKSEVKTYLENLDEEKDSEVKIALLIANQAIRNAAFQANLDLDKLIECKRVSREVITYVASCVVERVLNEIKGKRRAMDVATRMGVDTGAIKSYSHREGDMAISFTMGDVTQKAKSLTDNEKELLCLNGISTGLMRF